MRDLMKIAYECMEKLDNIGVEYGTVDRWKINYRAKSRWGRCSQTSYGHFTIEINNLLLDEKVCDIVGLEETILHELCHTVKNCQNHKEPWNRVVAKVNNAYGYNIKRANSMEDKHFYKDVQENITKAQIEKELNKPQYAIQCTRCKYIYYRQKMSNAIKNPQDYKCHCGGALIRVYWWE